jgi:outer membrane protein assembly factor BamB
MFLRKGKQRIGSGVVDLSGPLSDALRGWGMSRVADREDGDELFFVAPFPRCLFSSPESLALVVDMSGKEIAYEIRFRYWAAARLAVFLPLACVAGFLLLSDRLFGLYLFPDFDYPSSFEIAAYVVPMMVFWGIIWPLLLSRGHGVELEGRLRNLIARASAQNAVLFPESDSTLSSLPAWRVRLSWGLLFFSLLGVGYLIHRRSRLGAAHFGYSFASAQPDWNLTRRQENRSGADLSRVTPSDFPGFLGKKRDCAVENVQLEPDWTKYPPKLLWRHEIGGGWPAFSVVNGFAVTMEQRGPEEQVTCYEARTGKHYWTVSWNERFFLFGDGPRSTPTIACGKVYALGAWGHLVCVAGDTGKVIWERELLKDLGMDWREEHREVLFGRSNSPLVVDGLVIVPGGGKNGEYASLLAYDAETGAPRWRGGNRQISYSSPTLARIAGVKQIVIVNEDSVSGHDITDGKELWSYPWPGDSTVDANVSQAVPVGDDYILLSSGYSHGAALIRIDRSGGVFTAENVWRNSDVLRTKFTNVAIWENHIYGISDTKLECVELSTGKRRWKKGRYGHGQILRARNLLLVLGEGGKLSLVRLDPEKPNDTLGSIQALSGKTWNNMALYGDILLVRNATEAACYRLKLKK